MVGLIGFEISGKLGIGQRKVLNYISHINNTILINAGHLYYREA